MTKKLQHFAAAESRFPKEGPKKNRSMNKKKDSNADDARQTHTKRGGEKGFDA